MRYNECFFDSYVFAIKVCFVWFRNLSLYLTLQMLPSLNALISCFSMKIVDFLMNSFMGESELKLFDWLNQPFETSSQTNKTKQWILVFHPTLNEEKLFRTTVASKVSLIWLLMFKIVFLNQNIPRIFLWNLRCFPFESDYVESSLNEIKYNVRHIILTHQGNEFKWFETEKSWIDSPSHLWFGIKRNSKSWYFSPIRIVYKILGEFNT